MRKLAKSLLNQGHGKIGYILEFTEIETFALRKHLDGKKIKKGSPLWLALHGVRQSFPSPKIEQTKVADLINPLERWNK